MEQVPVEYQPQHRTHANPPTLMLTIDKLTRKAKNFISKTYKKEIDQVYADFHINEVMESYGGVNNLAAILQFITNAFPRLEKWFRWFQTEQSGGLACVRC